MAAIIADPINQPNSLQVERKRPPTDLIIKMFIGTLLTTQLAFGIVAFTGALPLSTIGIVLLSTSGAVLSAFAAIHFTTPEEKRDWTMLACIIAYLSSFILGSILGITGQISGTNMGWVSLFNYFAIIGYALSYAFYRSIKKCYLTCGVTPNLIAQELASDYRLRGYFQIHPQEEVRFLDRKAQIHPNELITLFKRVLSRDLEFANRTGLQLIENFDIDAFIRLQHDNDDVRLALEHFLTRHNKHMTFACEYAIDAFNAKHRESYFGVL